MSYIKQFQPYTVSFLVDFQQIKSITEELIKETIHVHVPVSIDTDKLISGEIRILIEFDDSQLSKEDIHALLSKRLVAGEPYNNGDNILYMIFPTAYVIREVHGDGKVDGSFIVDVDYDRYMKAYGNFSS